MSNDSNEQVPNTKLILMGLVCVVLFIIACISVLDAQAQWDLDFAKKNNTPIAVVMMEDMKINISTYTMSPQTIILEKGTPRLRYVYSGNYDSKYIIQGIRTGESVQTFYPIYVDVGDTLNFSWEDSFGPYSSYNKVTRRYVFFTESWTYKITEITNQQVTLERFKLISSVWK